MKNVFVTGATSFIGINLIKELLKRDYNVIAIVRKNSNKLNLLPVHEKLQIVECNLEKITELPNLTNKKCDIFYHLAWNGTRGRTRDDKMLQESNYEYSLNALEVALKLGTKIFLSAGSQAEYGLHDNLVSESTKEEPNTEYGKSKLKFCNFALKYCKDNNIQFIEPRFFSLYGYGDFENTLIISTIKKMLKNEEIDLTECVQKWNFLHIDDAVDALIKLQESNCFGIFNFGSKDTRQLKEFVYEMYNLTNSSSKLNFGKILYPNGKIINVNPDTTKLRSAVNWDDKITFRNGIIDVIERSKGNEKN